MSFLSLNFSTDLETEMTFYGSYHANATNKLVHFIFVPTILWSGLVWFAHPSFALAQGTVLGDIPLDISFFVALGYALYYIRLEPVAGALYTPFLYFLLYTAHLFRASVPHAVLIATGVHALSWAMQIWAHQVFEKRAPALLDNLFQALVLAPLFVFFEFLFAFGYRPQLHQNLKNKIGVNIAAYRKGLREAKVAAYHAEAEKKK
ncbi:DUF962-domain-containing protein [Gonapodya prolifera JEL478]|uniref:DUF962-domain-containing protein n=1 Tax=Gonapodya prolifera (strain JEL478) TaxID=1344416 RepID=A0A139AAY3_GONPJ|nr:DUF962-domain-containing protein [Gonapodya prolifera JEL478]|eukprot:KXS13991.1 DUF962-domain-containing protein [Gonapodya prolifera JEL478]